MGLLIAWLCIYGVIGLLAGIGTGLKNLNPRP